MSDQPLTAAQRYSTAGDDRVRCRGCLTLVPKGTPLYWVPGHGWICCAPEAVL